MLWNAGFIGTNRGVPAPVISMFNAVIRMTSPKANVTIAKKGPRSRKQTVPKMRARKAEIMPPTTIPTQGDRPQLAKRMVDV